MSHREASLSETGRLRLARCVVEQGWPVRPAANGSGLRCHRGSLGGPLPGTGCCWHVRSRLTAPRSPNQTPTRTERRSWPP